MARSTYIVAEKYIRDADEYSPYSHFSRKKEWCSHITTNEDTLRGGGRDDVKIDGAGPGKPERVGSRTQISQALLGLKGSCRVVSSRGSHERAPPRCSASEYSVYRNNYKGMRDPRIINLASFLQTRHPSSQPAILYHPTILPPSIPRALNFNSFLISRCCLLPYTIDVHFTSSSSSSGTGFVYYDPWTWVGGCCCCLDVRVLAGDGGGGVAKTWI